MMYDKGKRQGKNPLGKVFRGNKDESTEDDQRKINDCISNAYICDFAGDEQYH